MDSYDRGKSSNHSQIDVWHSFASGNTQYFEQVFRKYYKQMYGYGLKLCNRPELVEDCIQELFETLWEKRDELAHIHSPNVYLFVSLRRKILGVLKKQNIHREMVEEASDGPFIEFGMEDIILRKESNKLHKNSLHAALNQLPNRQKEVLFLHFYNGMSYGEIEEILSINRQSVRNHMYRAMETLRTLLDSEVMKLVIALVVMFLFSIPSFL